MADWTDRLAEQGSVGVPIQNDENAGSGQSGEAL
jgi:hypothetical protein